MTTAIVVGGGISGIAAAAQLVERGYRARLFEAEEMLGGRIGTTRRGDEEIDLGGRNFSSKDESVLALLSAFGITELGDYRFNSVAVGSQPTFDLRTGGTAWQWLGRTLKNLVHMRPAGFTRAMRTMRSALRDPQGNLIGSTFWAQLAERTGDPNTMQYFGRPVADGLLRPFTLRMMASEPEEIFLGNIGPFLGIRSRKLKRVGGGMGKFLHAVEARLPVTLRARIDALVFDGARHVVGVRGAKENGERFEERADLVVLATPAPNAADLVSSIPPLERALREIAYRPVATVVAGYTEVAFPGNVGGLFLPRGIPLSHIARYEGDNLVRFSFAGADARKLFDGCSIDDLLSVGEDTFRQFGGRLGSRQSQIGRIWQGGLCGHSKMHHRRRTLIRALVGGIHGLVLVGDYFRGNSLEACATAAKENVDFALTRST